MTKSPVADGILCLTAAALLVAGQIFQQVLLYFPAAVLLLWRTHLGLKGGDEKAFRWGTLLLVLTALLLPPDLSDDHHRYLWEGFVQNQGYSPYSNAPESLYRLLDHPSEGKVNNADLTAIYPPLTQFLFRLADVFYNPLLGWKLLILATLLPIFCSCRDGRNTILLAMPLLLFEGIWNAHVDVLGVLPGFILVSALKSHKPWPAGLALAAMIAVKIVPLIFAPLCFMHFRGRNRIAFFAAVVLPLVIMYLPYLHEGEALFASFVKFSREWYFNNPFFHALRMGSDKETARLIMTGILMLSLITIFFIRGEITWKLTAAWMAVILCSPTVHPWYLLWLIPLIPSNQLPRLNLAYGAVFLAYIVLIRYRAEGVWLESPWWMLPEWAALLYLFAVMGDFRKRGLSQKSGD